ncbi:MAG: hypothetical protein NTU57_02535 [Candidatus Aenigmarchaeota archaeon]|nr:hypothetical protein [Candidatus Aenigmarchaeota archaeon]
MMCPIRSLNSHASDECVERHCAFWNKNECVITGFLRSFVKGNADDRDEASM